VTTFTQKEDFKYQIKAVKPNGMEAILDKQETALVLPNTGLGYGWDPIDPTKGEITVWETQESCTYNLVLTPWHHGQAGAAITKRAYAGTGGTMKFTTGQYTAVEYDFAIIATKRESRLALQVGTTFRRLVLVYKDLAASISRSTINFSETVTVTIPAPQPNCSYRLVDANGTALSGAVSSNITGSVTLTSVAIKEDVVVNIHGTNLTTNAIGILDVKFPVQVHPNLSLVLKLEKTPVDYDSIARIGIENSQASCRYQLKVKRVDDVVPDHAARVGQNLGAAAVGNGETLWLDTSKLKEDHEVYVVVTKVVNKLTANLTNTIEVPLIADLTRAVTLVQPSVDASAIAVVRIENPQQGVQYQLRFDGNNHAVGMPIYDAKNKGVGVAMIEAEFSPNEYPFDDVRLPSGPITKERTFNVLANKPITKIARQMNQKVTVTVNPPVAQ
jgi:hypothetical protein